MSAVTLFHLVDQNGRAYLNLQVPKLFSHGELPRFVQYQALHFVYERPMPRVPGVDAHQYRFAEPLDLSAAEKCKLVTGAA